MNLLYGDGRPTRVPSVGSTHGAARRRRSDRRPRRPPVIVGVRPEALHGGRLGGLDATVDLVEELGSESYLYCTASACRARLRSSSGREGLSSTRRGDRRQPRPEPDDPAPLRHRHRQLACPRPDAMPETRDRPVRWAPSCTSSGPARRGRTCRRPAARSARAGSRPRTRTTCSWFPNRWPAMEGDRCEVVLYTPVHDATFASLGVDGARKVIDLWAERTAELGARDDVDYVLVFENRGPEVGATIAHPHGQIYAYDHVPSRQARRLAGGWAPGPVARRPARRRASTTGSHACRRRRRSPSPIEVAPARARARPAVDGRRRSATGWPRS